MDFPKELKYSKSHEYLKVQGNLVTIGVTSYASNELGDVVFVDIPEIGKTYKTGEKFGVIESVKSVSDLYIPCDGKVVETNKDLNDHPEYINQDPYEKGWIIKVEITKSPDQNKELISADEYSKFVLAQAH
ncbi:MAG: glycine cleavage system protein H [Candidatus Melainabacteria bacterium RIFCSPLOWO2_02_FULL_35_15]|nr:MAG: glycine cleavage system protein H [Candidatus Melainabacteria bacterium RIFCSPLOWO2_12_FULL_35_11]OGI13527.1 MAG: glycine cleavage system protein H [Candidatus Melainabacteria bacterium RIFCSPLOWO2_02_FULL_35_15]